MRMKGSGFISTYNWVAKRFGTAALEKVKNALSADDQRELFTTPILTVHWYDYNAYFRWITVVDRIVGKGDFRLVREAAEGAARDMFHGVYKFFISLTNPRFILNNSPAVWRQMFDEGNVIVEWPAPKHVIIKLSQVSSLLPHHELDQAPALEEVTRLSGAKNLHSLHSKCLARGDAACWFEMTWD